MLQLSILSSFYYEQKTQEEQIKTPLERKSGVKKWRGGGKEKTGNRAEDKTGKKVMICVTAKKTAVRRDGGRVGRRQNCGAG